MAQRIASRRNSQGLIDKPFFLSPRIRLKKISNLSLNQLKEENGFTLVELIVVVMMIGILSSIAIPQFMSAADKAKQKEASAIVASMIKAATAYQTEYGALPQNFGELAEYAKFQECPDTAGDVEGEGGRVCKNATPGPVADDAVSFFASSGHYAVEMLYPHAESGTTSIGTLANLIFQVKANPNGGAYATNGSAVVGCYNPTAATAQVYEYTAKSADKGVKDYKDC